MSLDPIALLAILLGLQAKHFLFDFVFQSDWQVSNKGRYGHPAGLLHAGLHGLGTLVVMLAASLSLGFALMVAVTIAVVDFVIHYHVDWLKAQTSRLDYFSPRRHGYWIAMGGDQLAHHITYIWLVGGLVLAIA
ncbi:MAG: DUF3307 domain-containing protein [Devosiaceae bacterium]|nr:DUF3307 domain-containing protein [Devosiaceae bacterium MH13]